MLAMPLAGRMRKFGCRAVLAVILAAFLFILPALSAISPTSLMMAITLFFFVPVQALWV